MEPAAHVEHHAGLLNAVSYLIILAKLLFPEIHQK